jgi:UPF0716 protein FxsA
LNPFGTLLLLFLIVPLAEIYLLIKAGGAIGALNTVALVVFTAVVGAWLLRLQGLATLRRVQLSLEQGELPETALIEGVMLLLAGALLLTPGFISAHFEQAHRESPDGRVIEGEVERESKRE